MVSNTVVFLLKERVWDWSLDRAAYFIFLSIRPLLSPFLDDDLWGLTPSQIRFKTAVWSSTSILFVRALRSDYNNKKKLPFSFISRQIIVISTSLSLSNLDRFTLSSLAPIYFIIYEGETVFAVSFIPVTIVCSNSPTSFNSFLSNIFQQS
jgi:hypothetical protein